MRIGFREYRARAKERRERLAAQDKEVMDRLLVDIAAWPLEMRRRAAVTLPTYVATGVLIGGSAVSLGFLLAMSFIEVVRGTERIYPVRSLQDRLLDIDTVFALGSLLVYGVVTYLIIGRLRRGLTKRLGLDNLAATEDEDDTAYVDARNVWDGYRPNARDGDVDRMAVTLPLSKPEAFSREPSQYQTRHGLSDPQEES